MKAVYPETKGDNKGHYAPGVISHGMLYISGQLSKDPDTGKIPEGGVAEHMKQALSNLDRVLAAAGASREDVVQCRIYLSDISGWDEINEVYREFFGDHRPARIVVPAGPLHFGCLTEIEAVAEMDKED